MKKRYTLEGMQEIAKSKGGECLSKKYVNAISKMRWKCKERHIWRATPRYIKSGKWCPSCARIERANTILKEMQINARKKGGECFSEKYVNSQTKLKWRCKEGHIWRAIPGKIKGGSWCPICASIKQANIRFKEMQDIAKSKGGECLSKRYIKASSKLRWKCKEKHIWEATPSVIKSGSWCPICVRINRANIHLKEMQIIARKKGGKCFSEKYVNSQTKLKWKCKDGHVWKTTPNSVIRGHWCPYCAGLRKTINDMQRLAEMKGGECLSKQYMGKDTKLQWKCKEGHTWETTPAIIRVGSWCPHCSGRYKTIEDMHKLAEDKDGKCLSKKYINHNTKLLWECNKGHRWEATPSSIKRGSWCPYCSGRHKTIKDMQKMANEKGGKCLSTEYVNSHTKLRWMCEKGHQWEAIPYSIKRGHWCPLCMGVARFTIEDMHKLANNRGGRCLSTEYINSQTKLRWECEKGHVWGAAPNSIKRGYWCPHCAGVARLTIEEMQELAKARDGQCLSRKYINSKTKLKWKCKKGHVWEALPYGVKRGDWCLKCSRKERKYDPRITIEEIQELARAKGGECLSEKYGNPVTKLKWKCARGHEWKSFPYDVKNKGSWCRKCADLVRGDARRLTIEEMQNIAKEGGGECLSAKYVDASTKLTWKCKEGHVWEAMPMNIKYQETWCPKCATIERSEAYKLTIEDMHKIAKEKEGECLSKEYVNVKTKLKWRCKEGHEWEAQPGNIRFGTWCPYCGGSMRLTIKEMRKIAKKKQGKCLSKEYVNARTKLKWKCKEGHEWEALPNNIKRGGWCPVCFGRSIDSVANT